MVIRSLLAVAVVFLLSQSLTQARSLKGGVSLEEQHHNLKLEKQEAKMSSDSEASLTKEGGVVKQPAWITGSVYTNDQLYMYSYWQIYPFKKQFKWKIPGSKNTNITFSDSIVKNWKGYMPKRAGKVVCEPIQSSNSRFKFYHKDPKGPSGFFERAGFSGNGFHRYRIWFNETKSLAD